MSNYDDDDIEFDFFDEPETQETARRGRLPKLERPRARPRPDGGDRPPRQPLGPAPGLTPLIRLVSLIAGLIFIVVILVFWARSCQGSGKHSAYATYMDQVRTLANGSDQIGRDFAGKLTTPGIKESQLESDVASLAQQAQQQVAQAQTIGAPGPLRTQHMHLIETLDLRAKGLSRFADALRRTAGSKNSSSAGALLAAQARLLTASDVDWQFFFHDFAVEQLKTQGVTGVNVPQSQFLPNPDLVNTSSMVQLVQSFGGASTGGSSNTSGKHGDSLVSVKVLPQNVTLSTSSPTTVHASTSLAFVVTVQNSGCCRELRIPVTLTIQAAPKPTVRRKVVPFIDSGQTQTVTFTDIGQPPFGSRTTITVRVGLVPHEANTSNNSASYPVFFSIS
ncbi:MAG TPA: hypothetical protein VJ814_10055 [Gaiellaceae bacterium]|nr:hypothetical protein [Gaiellaceae bacterium]